MESGMDELIMTDLEGFQQAGDEICEERMFKLNGEEVFDLGKSPE